MFKITRTVLFCLLCGILIFLPSSAFAEKDDGGDLKTIYVRNIYYIPWIPGFDNCYGAYRILLSEGKHEVYASAGIKKKTQKKDGQQRNITEGNVGYYDDKDFTKGDFLVLTDFPLIAFRERREENGNTVLIHEDFFAYETPHTIIGYDLDMSPFFGSAGPLNLRVVDRTLLEKNITGFSTAFLNPAYMSYGTEPKGKITASTYLGSVGNRHYNVAILSLEEKAPESIGWWTDPNFSTGTLLSALEKETSEEEEARLKAFLELIKQANGNEVASLLGSGSAREQMERFFALDNKALEKTFSRYIRSGNKEEKSTGYYKINMENQYRTFINPREMRLTWENAAKRFNASGEEVPSWSFGNALAMMRPGSVGTWRGNIPPDLFVLYSEPTVIPLWLLGKAKDMKDKAPLVSADAEIIRNSFFGGAVTSSEILDAMSKKGLFRDFISVVSLEKYSEAQRKKYEELFWNEPDTPWSTKKTSIWAWAKAKIPSFYEDVLPYASLEFVPVLWGFPDSLTGWKKGTMRSFLPSIINSERTVTKETEISKVDEKEYEWASSFAKTLRPDLKDDLIKADEGEKAYYAGNFGTKTLSILYSEEQVILTGTKMHVKRFPVKRDESVKWISKYLKTTMPDFKDHDFLWSVFGIFGNKPKYRNTSDSEYVLVVGAYDDDGYAYGYMVKKETFLNEKNAPSGSIAASRAYNHVRMVLKRLADEGNPLFETFTTRTEPFWQLTPDVTSLQMIQQAKNNAPYAFKETNTLPALNVYGFSTKIPSWNLPEIYDEMAYEKEHNIVEKPVVKTWNGSIGGERIRTIVRPEGRSALGNYEFPGFTDVTYSRWFSAKGLDGNWLPKKIRKNISPDGKISYEDTTGNIYFKENELYKMILPVEKRSDRGAWEKIGSITVRKVKGQVAALSGQVYEGMDQKGTKYILINKKLMKISEVFDTLIKNATYSVSENGVFRVEFPKGSYWRINAPKWFVPGNYSMKFLGNQNGFSKYVDSNGLYWKKESGNDRASLLPIEK